MCAALLLVLAVVRADAANQMLLLSGSTGSGYTIEGSNDLVDWDTLRTVENLTGALEVPYAELGDYSYYRVSHAGANDLRAVGLAIFEEVGDPAQLEAIRLAARDQALAAIATNQSGLTTEQINELFSDFATQEAFNSAVANATTAATNSPAAVNRILDVLANHSATVSAADLDSIRALALSTGLASGMTSAGSSLTDVLASVTSATQNLDATSQQAASQYAQVAATAAALAQLLGANSSTLLQDAVNAVSAAISSGQVTDLFGAVAVSTATSPGATTPATGVASTLGGAGRGSAAAAP